MGHAGRRGADGAAPHPLQLWLKTVPQPRVRPHKSQLGVFAAATKCRGGGGPCFPGLSGAKIAGCRAQGAVYRHCFRRTSPTSMLRLKGRAPLALRRANPMDTNVTLGSQVGPRGACAFRARQDGALGGKQVGSSGAHGRWHRRWQGVRARASFRPWVRRGKDSKRRHAESSRVLFDTTGRRSCLAKNWTVRRGGSSAARLRAAVED